MDELQTECKHFRNPEGWTREGFVSLVDDKACVTCGLRLYPQEIELFPIKPVPLNIKTIYTSNGHAHGGESITSVVHQDGVELPHTSYTRTISYEHSAGLRELGILL